ncbi:transposase [Novosphingobium chloroacetimidivorans]|uniref:Transposase n=1 Tax=Novosphingobium chloroacetimidivorans TaxID=1428314 RepID=A0A7W7KFJ4_9SPHN|nr:IS66 family transposase [Novosphingobium chloroacetimidivorans]MBB4861153.1 transposase [Novosphingobium chloroacetimidivorans]
MSIDVASLPDDVAFLKALLVEVDADRNAHKLIAERLKIQLARLRRMQFGSSSEKITREIEQLELALEEVEAEAAATRVTSPRAEVGKPVRQPLPDHLPREEVLHEPACICPDCGGPMRRIGDDITEQLDYVPASFRVIRHVRPKLGCRACDRIVQAPLPSMPVERGKPGAGLLAHILVAKYADHLPLYRQSEIYAREGVDLARSTMADWVGRSASLLEPLVDALARHVTGGDTLHADDTPVPVLAPGAGRTRTGRLWVYVRDERGHGGSAPPAALFRYAPDRKGERPVAHLSGFVGHVHADGYAGFNKLYGNRIAEVACMAHVRRKFFDIHAANGSAVAREAFDRIAALYAVEDDIRGAPPERRRSERQTRAGPLLQALRTWLETTLPKLSRKSDLAIAVRYALSRWQALGRYLDDGRLEIDNNAAERALRGVALGRKNWLFAGSDKGGERAAAIYSLIETAKLNGVDPEAWLRDTINRIADHPNRQIDDLLPWNYRAA